MSIAETDKIDAIGEESATGKVILTLVDHLDWEDEGAHLALLQAKLNIYLAFVEGGELESAFPAARARPVAIDIVFRASPTTACLRFLELATPVVQSAGIELRTRTFPEAHMA